MTNSADPDHLASSVWKGRVYPGSAAQELKDVESDRQVWTNRSDDQICQKGLYIAKWISNERQV